MTARTGRDSLIVSMSFLGVDSPPEESWPLEDGLDDGVGDPGAWPGERFAVSLCAVDMGQT